MTDRLSTCLSTGFVSAAARSHPRATPAWASISGGREWGCSVSCPPPLWLFWQQNFWPGLAMQTMAWLHHRVPRTLIKSICMSRAFLKVWLGGTWWLRVTQTMLEPVHHHFSRNCAESLTNLQEKNLPGQSPSPCNLHKCHNLSSALRETGLRNWPKELEVTSFLQYSLHSL